MLFRSYNLPLFNDEERAKVGTVYKQQSREEAIKIGLDFFGPNMKAVVEKVEAIVTSYGLGVSGLNSLKKKPIQQLRKVIIK